MAAHKLYPTHIPTTKLQKLLLAAGSAATAIVSPWRGDAVACMGETTAQWSARAIRERMLQDIEGAEVLRLQPRITNSTVDLEALGRLEDGTLGREYARFLDKLETTPDNRPPVQFVDHPPYAYVMMRYRETHDLYHTVLGLPTNMLGEVLVKWFEGVQFGLPMCVLGGVFGACRLKPKQRENFQRCLPVIVENARSGRFLMSVFWERYWTLQLSQLRQMLNLHNIPLVLSIIQAMQSQSNKRGVDLFPKAGSMLGADPTRVDEAMKRSIIRPGFEKDMQESKPKVSRKAAKLAKKEEEVANRWYGLGRAELSAERKRDLEVLAMRSVVDTTAHYRRNYDKGLPENFQIGRVVDNAVDYYSSRIPKRQRKSTIVDELLADAQASRNLKQKYAQVLASKKHLRVAQKRRNHRKI